MYQKTMNGNAGVFISHITEEQEVAAKLKSGLRHAFGSKLNVFVSSDYMSIPGGDQWYSRIVESLKTVQVVLVLLSDQSVDRRWINFEAGIGVGADAQVIPLVIRGFGKSDVGPPLSQLQVRDLHDPKDVSALIHDIESRINIESRQVDAALLVEELEEIIRRIPSKGVSLEPYIERSFDRSITLNFRLLNTGNRDVELIELWAGIPERVKERNWHPMPVPPALTIESPSIEGETYVVKKYRVGVQPAQSGYYRTDFEVLSPQMSPTMSPLLVRELRFPVMGDLTEDEQSAVVRYEVHAKGIGSKGAIPLKEIRGF
jgi:hypothetical protein